MPGQMPEEVDTGTTGCGQRQAPLLRHACVSSLRLSKPTSGSRSIVRAHTHAHALVELGRPCLRCHIHMYCTVLVSRRWRGESLSAGLMTFQAVRCPLSDGVLRRQPTISHTTDPPRNPPTGDDGVGMQGLSMTAPYQSTVVTQGDDSTAGAKWEGREGPKKKSPPTARNSKSCNQSPSSQAEASRKVIGEAGASLVFPSGLCPIRAACGQDSSGRRRHREADCRVRTAGSPRRPALLGQARRSQRQTFTVASRAS
nr:hypothetical protein CFP56_09670 [Quercus suber]